MNTPHKKLGVQRTQGRSRFAKTIVTVAGLVALVAAPLIGGEVAVANPSGGSGTVYELEGEWTDPTYPTQEPLPKLSTGQAIESTWWLNVNDDPKNTATGNPSNEPVDNVVLTVVAYNADFETLPQECKTEGVEPASSITKAEDEEKYTLKCNFGTVNKGTAYELTTPARVTGSNEALIHFEASIGEGDGPPNDEPTGYAESKLPELEVENPFFMDMAWVANTGNQSIASNGYRNIEFNWTLWHGKGSPNGPTSVTFPITVTGNVTEDQDLSAVKIALADGTACAPFDSGRAAGHPWSSTDPEHVSSPEQYTNFPTCSLVKIGGATSKEFKLTISNINYDPPHVPSRDSTGALLEPGKNALYSGVVKFQVETAETKGGATLEMGDVTYTYAGGAFDDPADNNTSATTWAAGSWTANWVHGGSNWANTFLDSPGATVQSNVSLQQRSQPAAQRERGFMGGQCTILDAKYVTYESFKVTDGNHGSVLIDSSLYQVMYYTGGNNYLNGNLRDCTSDTDPGPCYNPNKFKGCHLDADPSGWTSTEPEDKSKVKAVRITYDRSKVQDSRVALRVFQEIKEYVDGVPIRADQDIWTWSAFQRYNNGVGKTEASWNYAYTGSKPNAGTDLDSPPMRYPWAGAGRDVLRVVPIQPSVAKTADPTVITAGDVVEYTVIFSGDTIREIDDPLDKFTLTDLLPAKGTFVEDSTEWFEPDPPEPGAKVGDLALGDPIVTTVGERTALTWEPTTEDDMDENTLYGVKYKVKFADDAVAGSAHQNVVTAAYAGLSKTSRATVIVGENGFTSITKTADKPRVPLSNDGKATATWTVSVRSADPAVQKYVDVIDVLPHDGDGRGTELDEDAEQAGVVVSGFPEGSTVYYTTNKEITSDDPNSDFNGSVGAPNLTNWRPLESGEIPAGTTAVRVISAENHLKPGGTFAFDVALEVKDPVDSDQLRNRAQGRADSTKLVMRTSAPVGIETGSVTWEKTDEKGRPLADSEWELTPVDGEDAPPTATQEGSAKAVTDCVEENADDCEGLDVDPAAGKLEVEDLGTGWYQLKETKAPAGYLLSAAIHYVEVEAEWKQIWIDGEGEKCEEGEEAECELVWMWEWAAGEFGEIENEQMPPTLLPLTGGRTAASFMMLAGAIGAASLGMFKRSQRLAGQKAVGIALVQESGEGKGIGK